MSSGCWAYPAAAFSGLSWQTPSVPGYMYSTIWYPEQWAQHTHIDCGGGRSTQHHRPRAYKAKKEDFPSSGGGDGRDSGSTTICHRWRVKNSTSHGIHRRKRDCRAIFRFVVTQLPLTAKCPTDSRRPLSPSTHVHPSTRFPISPGPFYHPAACRVPENQRRRPQP